MLENLLKIIFDIINEKVMLITWIFYNLYNFSFMIFLKY